MKHKTKSIRHGATLHLHCAPGETNYEGKTNVVDLKIQLTENESQHVAWAVHCIYYWLIFLSLYPAHISVVYLYDSLTIYSDESIT